MAAEHIVKAFDSELQRLDNTIAEMGGLAEAQLAETLTALVSRDAELAVRMIEHDDRIDALEAEVNAVAVRLLALRQPMADDLRAAVSSLKISSDLERIGDYAKNVAKRVVVLCDSPPIESVDSIGRLGRLVQAMIKSVLDAYVTRDGAKAEDVRNQDVDVDKLHTSLFRELLTYMMEDPRLITPCTHLLFIAKNLERIGDHATNIAESVLYLIHGASPDDERPKRDAASSTRVDAQQEPAAKGETT